MSPGAPIPNRVIAAWGGGAVLVVILAVLIFTTAPKRVVVAREPGLPDNAAPLLREVEKLWHDRPKNSTTSAGFGAARCHYTVNSKRNATGVIACGPVYAGADNSEQWDIYRFSTLRDTHAGTLVIGDVLYSTRSPTRPPGDLVLPN